MYHMKKVTMIIVVFSLALLGCEADQSAFSPDIAVSLSESDSIDLNEEELIVTVENVGDINAFDISVDIEVDERGVERDTISSLRAGESVEYTITLDDVENRCDTQDVLVAMAEPSVKDLNEANNEDSVQIEC